MWVTPPQNQPNGMHTIPVWELNRTPQFGDLFDENREGGELLDGDEDVTFLPDSTFNGILRSDSLWSTQILPDIKIEPAAVPEATNLSAGEWGDQPSQALFPISNIKIEPTLPDSFGNDLDLPELFEGNVENTWGADLNLQQQQEGMICNTTTSNNTRLPPQRLTVPLPTPKELPQQMALITLSIPNNNTVVELPQPQAKIPNDAKRGPKSRPRRKQKFPDPAPNHASFFPSTPIIQSHQITTTTPTRPLIAVKFAIPPRKVNCQFRPRRQVNKPKSPPKKKEKSYLYNKLLHQCKDANEIRQVKRAINTKNFHEKTRAKLAAAVRLLAKLLPAANYLLDKAELELFKQFFPELFK